MGWRLQYSLKGLAVATAVFGAELASANWLGKSGLFIVFVASVLPNCLLVERLLGGGPMSQPRMHWSWYMLSHLRLAAAAALTSIFAWLGTRDGTESILSPFPICAYLSFALGEDYWSLLLVPVATFVMMNLYLGRAEVAAPIPVRFPLILAVGSICTAFWFAAGWNYGLEYQDAGYVWSLTAINLAFVVGLWTFWFRKRKRATATESLLLGLLLHAWLFWFAFPWLGELP